MFARRPSPQLLSHAGGRGGIASPRFRGASGGGAGTGDTKASIYLCEIQ